MSACHSGHVSVYACRSQLNAIPADAYHVTCLSADFRFVSPREQRVLHRHPLIVDDLVDIYLTTDRANRIGCCTLYSTTYVLITRLKNEDSPTLPSLKKAIRSLAQQSVFHASKLAFNFAEDDFARYELDTLVHILITEFDKTYRKAGRYIQLYLCLPRQEVEAFHARIQRGTVRRISSQRL